MLVCLNLFSKCFACEASYTSGAVLREELMQYPESRSLFEEADKVTTTIGLPLVEIRIEDPTINFKASTQGNIIRIRPNLPPAEQRRLAIFEATNVTQLHKFAQVGLDAENGVHKTAETFVKAMERIEYEGSIREQKICSTISTRKFFKGLISFQPYFKSGWDFSPRSILGFEVYYNYFLSEKHKNHYRALWGRITKNENMNLEKTTLPITGWKRVAFRIGVIAFQILGFVGLAGNIYRIYTCINV